MEDTISLNFTPFKNIVVSDGNPNSKKELAKIFVFGTIHTGLSNIPAPALGTGSNIIILR